MAKKPKKSRALSFQVMTTNNWIGGETILLCPICRFAYVHLRGFKATHGSKVCLRLWCENGHSFSYVFRFHKGNMIVGLRSSEAEEC
jgi:hypothetical protein